MDQYKVAANGDCFEVKKTLTLKGCLSNVMVEFPTITGATLSDFEVSIGQVSGTTWTIGDWCEPDPVEYAFSYKVCVDDIDALNLGPHTTTATTSTGQETVDDVNIFNIEVVCPKPVITSGTPSDEDCGDPKYIRLNKPVRGGKPRISGGGAGACDVEPPADPITPCTNVKLPNNPCARKEVIDGKCCIIIDPETWNESITANYCPGTYVDILGTCGTVKAFEGTKNEEWFPHNDTVCLGDPYDVTGTCGTIKVYIGEQIETWDESVLETICAGTPHELKSNCGNYKMFEGTKVEEFPPAPDTSNVCFNTFLTTVGTCNTVVQHQGTKQDSWDLSNIDLTKMCPESTVCITGECGTVKEYSGELTCPDGTVCRNGDCVDPCTLITCADGQECREGVCYCNDQSACNFDDPETCIYADTANCLGCDGQTTCVGDESCVNGTCVDPCEGVTCPTYFECQGGDCVCTTPDTDWSPSSNTECPGTSVDQSRIVDCFQMTRTVDGTATEGCCPECEQSTVTCDPFNENNVIICDLIIDGASAPLNYPYLFNNNVDENNFVSDLENYLGECASVTVGPITADGTLDIGITGTSQHVQYVHIRSNDGAVGVNDCSQGYHLLSFNHDNAEDCTGENNTCALRSSLYTTESQTSCRLNRRALVSCGYDTEILQYSENCDGNYVDLGLAQDIMTLVNTTYRFESPPNGCYRMYVSDSVGGCADYYSLSVETDCINDSVAVCDCPNGSDFTFASMYGAQGQMVLIGETATASNFTLTHSGGTVIGTNINTSGTNPSVEFGIDLTTLSSFQITGVTDSGTPISVNLTNPGANATGPVLRNLTFTDNCPDGFDVTFRAAEVPGGANSTDWGDGNVDTGQVNPLNSYQMTGTYTVTSTDGNGNSITGELTIFCL